MVAIVVVVDPLVAVPPLWVECLIDESCVYTDEICVFGVVDFRLNDDDDAAERG